MKKQTQCQQTVLAIALSTDGVGYALFEGPRKFVDWQIHRIRADRNKKSLMRVEILFERCQPDILIIEDYAGAGSSRRTRIRRLIRSIKHRANKQVIETRQFSRGQLRNCFAPFGASTKHEIATKITAWFPELKPILPAKPKPWIPERPAMMVFDAVAMAIAYYDHTTQDPDRGA